MNTEDMPFAFIRGKGERDTRKYDGGDYEIGTFQDLWEMAVNPVQVDKSGPEAPWAIFTDTNGHLARNLEFQEAEGAATALWADIDEGSPTQATVVEAVRSIFPGVGFLVYHTAGAKPGLEKHRIILALKQVLKGTSFRAYQMALNAALQERGLQTDKVNESFTQLCFLPNKGQLYSAPHFEEGSKLDIQAFPEFTNSAIGLLEEVEKERLAKLERRRKFAENSGKKDETQRSVLKAFREKHPTEGLLQAYGFITQNGDDWHHPDLQGGNSYATELFPDGAMYTLSSSIGALGGHQIDNGWYFNDGFDL